MADRRSGPQGSEPGDGRGSGAAEPWWNADADEYAGAEAPLEGLSEDDTATDGQPRRRPAASGPLGPSEPSEPETPGTGSATVEIVRLLGAIGDWAAASGVSDNLRKIGDEAVQAVTQAMAEQQTQREAAADGHEAGAADEAEQEAAFHLSGSHNRAPCEICPLCQGMFLAREAGPHLVQAAARALAVVDEALRNPPER